MSRKHGTLEFSGGMNNVVPPHLLRDNEAQEIRNLYLDKDGIWKDINNPEIMLDLSATHLNGAIKVVQWKPTKVPSDCIDDFVYVVFTSDGVAKLVYRGLGEPVIYTIDIKARIRGTTDYRSVTISDVTVDLDGLSNGITSVSAYGTMSRRYYGGTQISMTAAVTAEVGEEFYQWIDGDTGALLENDRILSFVVNRSCEVIAEYVGIPYIKVENASGTEIFTLGDFSAKPGEYSNEKSYYVGGISLTNPIKIYPPTDFEIKKDGDITWTIYGNYIEISAATGNTTMTKISVRFAPPET